MWTKALVVLLVLGLAGCGGNSPNSPSPTAGSGSGSGAPTSVAIAAGVDLMKLKATGTFGLTANYSNGSAGSVQGTWRSDNPSVATVDTTGRVTATGAGETNIVGEFQGLRATQPLRVVPDYQGRWNGDFSVTGCTADGDFQRGNFCAEFPTPDLFALTMGLTQNRDAVNGSSDFGDLPGPVQGSIRTSGHLMLSASFTFPDDDIAVDVTLTDWEALTTDNERMTGRFAFAVRASRLQGTARIECDLRSFGKTSTTPVAAQSRAGGRIFPDAVSRAVRRR
jgi:Bacterial Ig-like domain (group 2)